jgi:hypothetical protein
MERIDLVIVTKHKKEQVIKPVLEAQLDVSCFVTSKFDTDSLGTFSGEVVRVLSPLDALRKKCLMGIQAEQVEHAVASEGSFGPHPNIPFLQANEEWVMYLNQEENLEIIARVLSTSTNAGSVEVQKLEELIQFAERVMFPSHGIILSGKKGEFKEMRKGIDDTELLHDYGNYLINKYGSCYAETDMRAMYNPTRMNVIERTTQRLVTKLNSFCSACGTPGFDVVSVTRGLPCIRCGFKTNSISEHIYKCSKCSYSEIQKFPNGETENPMYCDICNP